MQCPICKFQNMPDEEICTNCKALLRAYGIHSYPNRIKRFNRLRNFFRNVRMLLDPYSPVFETESEEKKAREPIDIRRTIRLVLINVIGNIKFILNPENPTQFWKRNRWIAAILSIIPGLGHLFLRQYRTALYFFLTFLGLILLYIVVPDTLFVIFIRAGIVSMMMIAIMSASPLDFIISRQLSSRLLTALLIYVIVFFFIIRPITNNYLDFICIDILHNPVLETNLKHRKLVLNRLFFNLQNVKRGDIIIYNQPETTIARWFRIRRSGNAFEKVIGLPGETIEIKNNKIFINGVELEKDKYPLTYIENANLITHKTELGNAEYFILPDIVYNVYNHADRELLEQVINSACKISVHQINGKAIPYL